MTEWNDQTAKSKGEVVAVLLTSLEQNDMTYLADGKSRDDWLKTAQEIDNKLTVIGLRLAVRPWAQSGR